MTRHIAISRFGLMHMIATNLCEWLYVLVEETKHEIIHLGGMYDIFMKYAKNNYKINVLEHNNATEKLSAKYCQEGNVMGSLVTNASPFLFPCTIEYSLICAVILFEMWKKVKTTKRTETVRIYQSQQDGRKDDKFTSHFHFSKIHLNII